MQKANNTLVPQNNNGNGSKGVLLAKFSEKFGVDPNKLTNILKATCFKTEGGVSDEQMAALLIVADQYGLNPFTKEIYAFPTKGSIVPIVGVDGWTRIMNEHPKFDGLEFRYAENVVEIQGSKPCPEWIEAVVYRSDRSHPTIIREYLDECFKSSSTPWKSHTRRFLRHRALIQGARTAFGFSGIYEEDEAQSIAEARVVGMKRDMPAAIDSEPVQQKSTSAKVQPQAQGTAEHDFFKGAEQPQQQQTTATIEDESIMGEEYNAKNAAEKKAALFENLNREMGIPLEKLEYFVGKSFAQWAKKERLALINAINRISNGADPVTVFKKTQ